MDLGPGDGMSKREQKKEAEREAAYVAKIPEALEESPGDKFFRTFCFLGLSLLIPAGLISFQSLDSILFKSKRNLRS